MCNINLEQFNNFMMVNGDCIETMKQMKDEFIDVSFTSPPYNDKRGDNEKSANGHKKYLHSETKILKEKTEHIMNY
jgi:DNA modification methylase